ncbi:hypothetical protein [Pelagivirga sediminicola]|uniref:hypothetical protein n=1 Tax=Pelagivirga sediminicola TaxID=2170575 RepID=UPI001FAE7CB2|nr:hypothetical protein [Pelagivirga sediminicola]
MSSQKDNRQANLTRGIRVEIASLVYNIIEVVVSVTVGLLTGSAALVSWGLDSTVEATSAATLIWRLKGEKDGAGKRTVLHRKKVALYVVACAFWIVVAAILYEVNLRRGPSGCWAVRSFIECPYGRTRRHPPHSSFVGL